MNAATWLRSELMGPLPVISVSALIDADQNDAASAEPWVAKLPVAMVENLLLVPESIWLVLAPQKEQVSLTDVAHVELVLREIARGLRDQEVQIRLRGSFSIEQPTVDTVRHEELQPRLLEQLDAMRARLADPDHVRTKVTAVEQQVDAFLEKGEELRRFHGKKILQMFYERHAKKAGIGFHAFVLQLARTIGERPELNRVLRRSLSELLPKPMSQSAAS